MVVSLSGDVKNAENLRILTPVLDVILKGLKGIFTTEYSLKVFVMGKVLAIMKIMPEDANAPIGELRKRLDQSLQGKVKIEAWEEIPIFGPLYALRLRFVVDDEAGGTASVEDLIKKTAGVSEIEMEAVSLL